MRTGVRLSACTIVRYDEAPLPQCTVAEQVDRRVPVYAVIPVKDRNDLTRRVIAGLHRQAGYASVFVFDNGSKPKNRKKLDDFVRELRDPRIRLHDANGWNLHRMWNEGIAMAARHAVQSHSAQEFDVAILNNDLLIGDHFLGSLSDALRSHDDLWAVSPNYDRRVIEGVQFVSGLAAGREDGTGGLAGFAFVVRGEAFAVATDPIGSLAFDEEYSWWFGDFDLVAQIVRAGKRLGVTGATTVVHIDGGSQSTASNTDMTEAVDGGRRFRPEFAKIIAADRAHFEEKWGVTVAPAAAQR